MEDLFPGSWQPETLGSDIVPYLWPTFFAVYPAKPELPRVVDWQRDVCGEALAPFRMRPAKLLHVSVAECGKPRQKRQPLPEILSQGARQFSFPVFDLTFDSVVRFGSEGRALVAIADTASQEIFESLRTAIADAQRHAGMFVSRGKHRAHLTLGYGDGLPMEPRKIEPFGFRVAAVDFVVSERGKSRHVHLKRWPLTQST